MGANRFFEVCMLVVFARKILMYEQSDYILTTERALISACNNRDVAAQVKFFKFNRTYTALNVSLIAKRDFGSDIVMNLQAYKFLSNEYRQFPMAFSRNVCAAIEQNEFGLQNLYSCGNFRGCPLNKGVHRVCNWGPDFSKFPPYIPLGQYKLDFEMTYLSAHLCTMEWYVKIVSSKLI